MLRTEIAKHRYMRLQTKIVSPDEIAQIMPVTNTDGIIVGLYDPLYGHLDSSITTCTYAKTARMSEATIEISTRVMGTFQRRDDNWDALTDQAKINTECTVNAAGLLAREVGAMAD